MNFTMLKDKPDTATQKTFPHPQGYSLMPDQASIS